jgi:hypothetical protein
MSVEATRGGGRSPTRIDRIEIGLGTKTLVGPLAATYVTLEGGSSTKRRFQLLDNRLSASAAVPPLPICHLSSLRSVMTTK